MFIMDNSRGVKAFPVRQARLMSARALPGGMELTPSHCVAQEAGGPPGGSGSKERGYPAHFLSSVSLHVGSAEKEGCSA